MFTSMAARSPNYRADIDGLRAVAILVVLLYHAGLVSFPGGFVGVDIFFVISGYLISSLLLRDIAKGQLSFARFYAHRIRRIFPAYIATMLLTTVTAACVFAPQALVEYAKGLLAATTFSSNFYFNKPLHSYFQQVSTSEVLLHTWSLSVEEQFYLIFPFALFLCFYLIKSHQVAVISLGFLLSFAFSIWGTTHAPSATFYLLPSRMWEFLTGTLLCVVTLPIPNRRIARELAGFAGLSMIAFAVHRFNTETVFPGWNALLPCAGAALLIDSGSHGDSITKKLLQSPPLVMIGVISYSLYLVHWPVIAFAKYVTASRTLIPGTVGYILLGSLALSCLSFLLVESPFRKSNSSFSNKRVIWSGLTLAAALACICLVIIFSKGLPQRYDPHAREMLAINSDRKEEGYRVTCDNWGRELHQYSDALFCGYGHEPKNILFWGDSHMDQLRPLVRQLYETNSLNGEGAIFATYGGCPPAEHINQVTKNYYCDAFTKFTMARALGQDIDTVFIQFSPWWTFDGALCASVESHCVAPLSGEEAMRRVADEFSANIRLLKSNGKRVIVGLPFPFYDKSIPEFEIRRVVFKGFVFGGAPIEKSSMSNRRQIESSAKSAGAEIYDPRKSLCTVSGCLYDIDGKSLYWDEAHLASSQLGILRDGLLRSLQPSR